MTQLPALEKSHLSCTDVGCKNFYNNFKEIHGVGGDLSAVPKKLLLCCS